MPLFLSTSLGKFNPSKFHEVTIATEFQEWLRSIGIVTAKTMLSKNRLPIEVRNPADNSKAINSIIATYHKDGSGGYVSASQTVSETGIRRLETKSIPSIQRLIVWSNGTPTELMSTDWREIRYSPCDVVLFDNHLMYHRCPPAEPDRWFVRLADPVLPLSMQ